MIFVILKSRYNIFCNSNLKRNLYPIFFFICFFLKSCASHPVINPHLPEPGITKRGYAISVENVAPFLWYRVGISEKSEFGLRLGLPIYGSGLDYSRVLYKKNNKWDMLNLSMSVNPNYNMDATYYKFKTKKNRHRFFKIAMDWFAHDVNSKRNSWTYK